MNADRSKLATTAIQMPYLEITLDKSRLLSRWDFFWAFSVCGTLLLRFVALVVLVLEGKVEACVLFPFRRNSAKLSWPPLPSFLPKFWVGLLASTRQRNTPRPTGRPTLNLTGLTDVQKEKMLRGNTSAVPLDHLGFPVIPNSHRGTRRPLPLTQVNASRPTPNSGKGVNGKPRPYGIMGEFREPENKTQTSTLSVSNTTISTDSEHSSKAPQTNRPQKNTRHDNKRDMPMVISKHGIWIAIVSSLLLSAFICLTVHWVRQRRRGKLIITPVSNNGQRSAAVVFKAWDRSSFQHRIPNRKSSELSHV